MPKVEIVERYVVASVSALRTREDDGRDVREALAEFAQQAAFFGLGRRSSLVVGGLLL